MYLCWKESVFWKDQLISMTLKTQLLDLGKLLNKKEMKESMSFGNMIKRHQRYRKWYKRFDRIDLEKRGRLIQLSMMIVWYKDHQ